MQTVQGLRKKMYRKPTPKQRDRQRQKLEAMRRGRERASLARGPRISYEVPDLRRVITITDHDTGQPVTHMVELRKSRRIDVYRVSVDGKPWRACGWSAVLAMLRKAYPRALSPRAIGEYLRDMG